MVEYSAFGALKQLFRYRQLKEVKRTMRVLIIGKLFPPSKKARARQLGRVTEALAEAGCEVVVIAGFEGGEKPRRPFPVKYIESKPAPTGRTGRFASSLRNSFQRRDWWRRAGVVADNVIREFQPDIILSSSSPYDSHYVALKIRQRNKIPWIAYFSDPWPPLIMPVPYRESPGARGILKTFWEIFLTRKILRECDALVMTNQSALRLMEEEVGIAIGYKGFTIPHIGSGSDKISSPGNNQLVHIGELCRRRSLPELLEAVKRVAVEMPERFRGLLLVGDVCREFRDLIRRKEMEEIVEFTGQISSSRAREIAAESRALLVIEAKMEVSPFLPSKFADYARTGRPIIAITPPAGAIRDYLDKYGGGRAVRTDADEISGAIREAFQTDDAGFTGIGSGGESPLSSPFKSENVAGLYLDMFEEVMESI